MQSPNTICQGFIWVNPYVSHQRVSLPTFVSTKQREANDMDRVCQEMNEAIRKKIKGEGCYRIKMVFHANQLSKYAITCFSNVKPTKTIRDENPSHEKKNITDIISENKPFPEYGAIAIDISLVGNKIVRYSVKVTERFHVERRKMLVRR
jgi:hypothetical protein